jgi:F0F1-type ATP synthase membrane subunit c/vacuolar-type H+-ATPase subunit K
MLIRSSYYWILSLVLSISFFIRIFLTFFRRFNADEFQHLHASWMIHFGYLPYRDFWENHAPLLYFLFAPVLGFFGEGIPAVLTARSILSLIGVAIAVVVYKIARLDHDQEIALLAVTVLSFSEIFVQKTIEFRTDQFVVLFWLISLLFCFRSFMQKKDNLLLLSGISLGIGMLFSPKALLCLTAAAVLIVLKNRQLAGTTRKLFLLALGFIVPMIPLAIYFYSQGALEKMVEATILQNLSYPDTRGPSFLVRPQNLGFLLLSFAGVYLSIKNKSCLLLLVPGLVLLAILIFLMPSTFSQSALTFIPIFAVYAGIALKESMAWRSSSKLKNSLFLMFTLSTALIIPVVALHLRNGFTITNREQLNRIEYILRNTTPEETIFDGNAAYVFRPQAYFYGSLVEGIRHQIDRGEIQENIVDALQKRKCRIVIYDDRVSDLPESVQNFIRSNYLSAGVYDVFVAGKELGAESISGDRATFWIELPFVYTIQIGTTNFHIDGKPYRKPVFLKRGNHTIVSKQQLSRIVIQADLVKQ